MFNSSIIKFHIDDRVYCQLIARFYTDGKKDFVVTVVFRYTGQCQTMTFSNDQVDKAYSLYEFSIR